VPETRGRDLLRVEDAIRLSTTEVDSAYAAEEAVVPVGSADAPAGRARD
jgi:MHS family metabolite:H+ symporter-like MFS transporter